MLFIDACNQMMLFTEDIRRMETLTFEAGMVPAGEEFQVLIGLLIGGTSHQIRLVYPSAALCGEAFGKLCALLEPQPRVEDRP